MADDQEWSFPDPPERGLDVQFDALADARHEAEDRDELLQIELAISLLLLSRNYDLTPAEYRRIFDFDGDRARLGAVQSAISELICSHSRRERSAPVRVDAAKRGESGQKRKSYSLVSSWARLVKTVFG
jgi:hypothetical protein